MEFNTRFNTCHRDFDPEVYNEVYLAIRDEDVGTLRLLINTRFNVYRQRNTLCLYQAIDGGNLEIVKLLLDAGIDRYYYADTDEFGLPREPRISPLYRAVSLENSELRWKMVKLLIESGVSPSREHFYHESSMCTAASRGDCEMVRLLFEFGAEVNSARQIKIPSEWSQDGHTYTYQEYSPLHVAVRELDGEVRLEMVRLLITIGADVNAKRWIAGETSLHLLSEKKSGSGDVFKLLHGADVELDSLTGSGSTPLALAALHGDIELMRLMIAAGADVNLFEKDISSPLFYAVTEYNKEAVQLLLENGANPNATDENGDNILCWAADFSDGKCKVTVYIDILKMLFAHGAKNRSSRIERNVPFQPLLASGTIEAMHVFFENGITLENCALSHLLHHSAQNARKDILEFLLKSNRYDVDEFHYEDKQGFAPIFGAVYNKRHQNVRLLIEWGADVNITHVDDDGDKTESSVTSPLFEAVYLGDVKTVDLLLSAGANMDADSGFEIWQKISNKILEPQFLTVLNPVVGEVALLKSQSCSNRNNGYVLMKKFDNLSPETEKRCEAELEVLKNITFYGSVTLYDLLRGKDIIRYMRNNHVAQNFKSQKVVEYFPIYGNRIKNTYSFAKTKRKVMDKAMVKLKRILNSRFCYPHEILGIIISYLRLKDLRNLCNV